MTEAFRLGFMSKMADISARRDALRNAALAGRIPGAFQQGTEGDAISEAVNNDSGVPDYSALASLSTSDPSAYFGRALPENAVSPEMFARQSGARTTAPAASSWSTVASRLAQAGGAGGGSSGTRVKAEPPLPAPPRSPAGELASTMGGVR